MITTFTKYRILAVRTGTPPQKYKRHKAGGVPNTHTPPNNAASYKHQRGVQTNQQHLQHATATIVK